MSLILIVRIWTHAMAQRNSGRLSTASKINLTERDPARTAPRTKFKESHEVTVIVQPEMKKIQNAKNRCSPALQDWVVEFILLDRGDS